MRIKTKDIIDALDTVVFIYGLAPEILAWKQFGGMMQNEGRLLLRNKPTQMTQVIWTICVELFGEYMTTPLDGWIDDIDGFYEFIDDITATAKEAEEFM